MTGLRKRFLLILFCAAPYRRALCCATSFFATSFCATSLMAQLDLGLCEDPSTTGNPISGLTVAKPAFFEKGKDAFNESDHVSIGLGPRFNLDGCGGCHSQPSLRGTSPQINPQFAAASKIGAGHRLLVITCLALVARRSARNR